MSLALPATLHRRLSIRTQLLALVLAAMLPAAGLVAYGIIDAWNEARAAAYRQVSTLALETASKLDLILRDNEALLARLAQRPGMKALDPRNCDPIVREFVSLHPEYTTLGVRDRHANVVCTHLRRPPDAGSVGALPWFIEGLRSERFTVGDAYLGPASGRWVSVLMYPVRDASANVSGLLLLSLDLLALQERVLRAIPRDAIVVVFDRDNNYLMRSIKPAEWIGKPLPRPQLDKLRAGGEGFFELTGVDGVTRLNAGAVVPVSGWRVYAALPKDVVFAAHRERLIRSVGIGIAVLLLALALANRIGSTIARSIGDLARSASDIADGGSPARSAIKGAAEIESVANGLSRLAGERALQRNERAALAAHYEQLMRLARDIVLLVDASGRIVEVNDAAVAAYGYSADELGEMHVRDLHPPEAQATIEENWQATVRPEGALFETLYRRKDGSTFPVEVSARVIEIEGQPYRQSFVRDISERKRAEEALRESEQRFMLAASTGTVWDWNIVTNQASFQYEFWRGLGYEERDIRDQTAMLESVLHPEDRPRWRQAIKDHVNRRLPYDLDFRARTKSGEYRWFNTKGQARWDENGRATYMAGTTFDITARKLAEQKNREQLDELLRWQELMLGREERMLQLKAEVNELLARQGQPPRYSVEAASTKDDK